MTHIKVVYLEALNEVTIEYINNYTRSNQVGIPNCLDFVDIEKFQTFVKGTVQ